MPLGDITPVLTLTVGAALTLLLAIFLPRNQQRLCCFSALLALAAAAGLTVQLQVASEARLTFSGTWAVDDLTSWASYVILAASAFVALLSPTWFSSDRRHGEWYVMLLFGALGAILMAGAADFMELMVAMLLSSVTGYTMASYHRASRMCAEAGAKYYFLGALANPMIFLGITFLYALAADTAYTVLAEHLADDPAPVVGAAGLGLILIGLAFKIGAVPGHAWVPDVSQGSPAPAAAFLTVVPKIGALAALFRIVLLLPDGFLGWRWTMALIAVLTMSLGNLAALWQDDVRRLLGWSSISQAGYGLLAVVAAGNAPLAFPALILFFTGYALANVAAFSVVVSLRGRTRLQDYGGLYRSHPGHAAALSISLLSLTGIPPLAGFAAKFALFTAAIEAGFAWLAVIAVLNTVVSLFYYLRVIAALYLGEDRGEGVYLLDAPSRLSVGALSLLVIVFGLASQIFFASDGVLVTRIWQ